MTRPSTLVWIDAREAVIVRWQDGEAHLERMDSEVPAHHRSTGHVRHDPGFRHGGGGAAQTAGEPHRLEHLERFVEAIADRLTPRDDILILGPGTVREHLEHHVCATDARQGRSRVVSCQPSAPLTERQLIARFRAFAGLTPRRRTVGAYRWSEPPVSRAASGRVESVPHRVTEKPAREPD